MPTMGVSTVTTMNNQILLVQREDFPIWCLPGGMIEPGESLAQTAIRETFEETGIKIQLSRLVGVYSRPNWRFGGNHEILFAAIHIGGSLKPQQGETEDVQYFEPDNLPKALFWWHRQRIKDALIGTQSIARTQDVFWPLKDMSLNDIHKLRDQEKLPLQEMYEQFCDNPIPGNDQIDVGEI